MVQAVRDQWIIVVAIIVLVALVVWLFMTWWKSRT
jgi:hypothetical protein